MKKSHKYAILYGAADSGLFEFLEYYADSRAEKGNPVVVRKNINDTF